VTLAEYLADSRAQIDAELERVVPTESEYPETIHRAMRHSLFAGGKRVRPILCLAAAEALNAREEAVVRAACSLELVHTYSLIHDDLPALDNDDFRRGVPTCHKVFGEAMAILAGDALLTLAFQVLADLSDTPAERSRQMSAELALAAGTVRGMIGGQVADLEAEGREIDRRHLEYIHRSKTGALLRASVRLGAIAGGASESGLASLSEYGEHIGLAFQIVDDVLDVVGSKESLGKTAGKDAAQKKATYPQLYGLDESRRMANEHLEKAVAALEPFGDQARWLRELAGMIVSRSA
jgi:geranylgeranyl diphosphate synthase type II